MVSRPTLWRIFFPFTNFTANITLRLNWIFGRDGLFLCLYVCCLCCGAIVRFTFISLRNDERNTLPYALYDIIIMSSLRRWCYVECERLMDIMEQCCRILSSFPHRISIPIDKIVKENMKSVNVNRQTSGTVNLKPFKMKPLIVNYIVCGRFWPPHKVRKNKNHFKCVNKEAVNR